MTVQRNFVVWEPSAGQAISDGRRFVADGPQHAAEQWADWSDSASNEYHIVGGQPTTVMVRDEAGGTVRELIVQGESIRRYTAKLRIAGPNDGNNWLAEGAACSKSG